MIPINKFENLTTGHLLPYMQLRTLTHISQGRSHFTYVAVSPVASLRSINNNNNNRAHEENGVDNNNNNNNK
jgi:hypothetical protein